MIFSHGEAKCCQNDTNPYVEAHEFRTAKFILHAQLDVTDSGEIPLHRELTFGDTVPSMGSIAADLAAAQLSAGGTVPSRWVAEDSSSQESDTEELGQQQLDGDREHPANDEDLEDVSLLADGQTEDSRRMNGNGQHRANGEHHHGGLNGMSHEAGSDEDEDALDDDELGAAKGKKGGRLPRAASKGRLVQVCC